MKKTQAAQPNKLSGIKKRLSNSIEKSSKAGVILVPLFVVALLMISWFGYKRSGTEIFPKVDAGQMQVRLRLPAGTRIERTEDATKNVLSLIDSIAGKNNVDITSSYVGLQAPTYAINSIFLFTSGPHEAVIKVNLLKHSGLSIETVKEQLRTAVKNKIPELLLSFEPADLVDQVMSLGSSNPVEIVIQGRNISQSRELADRLKKSLTEISYLRDVQIAQPLDYPTLQINYDRIRAGQMNLPIEVAGKSVADATSSSRLTQPVYWLDKVSGTAYQVQVEYPQLVMNTAEQLDQVPVGKSSNAAIYLRDVADLKKGNSIGEYDRINQQRFITVTANIYKKDLGTAIADVNNTIKQLGELPTGMKVYLRGQSELLSQTTSELSTGLLLALFVIGLILAAYFQSFKLSLVVLSVFPGVLAGSIFLLWITGNTLNIQSFMGSIMAIGVAVSNAILIVSNAEMLRKQSTQVKVGASAAANRLRPILMTSFAMIAGMLPMALGIGESGKQTAPLGIAVIGGLLFSSFISLWLVPLCYDLLMGKNTSSSVSLDPDDTNSNYYDN